MSVRFRFRPVTIEARQLNGNTAHEHDIFLWIKANTQGSFDPLSEEIPAEGVSIDPADGSFMIATLEGVMHAHRGDWIIRDATGAFHVCQDNTFRATHEPVEDGAA